MSTAPSIAPGLNPGEKIRAYRAAERISLDAFADRIAEQGCERPSIAKLSRIETGVQPVTFDILDALVTITGIPPQDLMPEVAAKFAPQEGEAATR